jgi:hypothetical protein
VDGPPVPAGGTSNTLEVTVNGAELDVKGSLVAGTVSIAVRNIGDGLHTMFIGRLLEGKTLDDARNALRRAGPDVTETDALQGIVEHSSPLTALGAGRLPGASTLTVSGVAAGEYVLAHVPNDNAGRPEWTQAGVQPLTIAAGESGPGPAADVTYTVHADSLDGPDRLPAGPTTIGIVDGTGTPRVLNVFRITDHNTAETVAAWANSGGAPLDWSHAPIERLTSGYATDTDQMITLDLTPGQWIIEKSLENGPTDGPLHAVVLVTVS